MTSYLVREKGKSLFENLSPSVKTLESFAVCVCFTREERKKKIKVTNDV